MTEVAEWFSVESEAPASAMNYSLLSSLLPQHSYYMDKPLRAAYRSDRYISLHALRNTAALVRIVLKGVTLLQFVVQFERSG
jgi:hypothetical protein